MSESVHGIFLRIEGYALVAANRKAGRNTLHKVAAEAMRVEGHCGHVKDSLPPLLIYGNSPLLLVKEHEDRAPKAMSRYLHKPSGAHRERLQRKDRPIAVAGVISVPDSWNEQEPRWQLFKGASICWLIAQFGAEHLHCVIEHKDERCLHLHFFLNPLEHEDISSVHPGLKAVRSLDACALPRQRRAVFENAMRAMLDQFHERVGQQFGLVRRHIGAKRMSRRNWHIWNGYRQRARAQQERIEQESTMGIDIESLKHSGELLPSIKGAQQFMTSDPNRAWPADCPVDVVDVHVDGSRITHAGFLVPRKNLSSVNFDLSTLEDYQPSTSYSWVRPRDV